MRARGLPSCDYADALNLTFCQQGLGVGSGMSGGIYDKVGNAHGTRCRGGGMSGLLGPVVAQGITPDSGQGRRAATAISTFFRWWWHAAVLAPRLHRLLQRPAIPRMTNGGTSSRDSRSRRRCPAPAPTVPSLNVGPGLAQAPPQAAPRGRSTPAPVATTCGGGRAPAPAQAAPRKLPGLADILAMIKAEQDKQAAANQQQMPQGLLGGGGSEGGGGGAEGTM